MKASDLSYLAKLPDLRAKLAHGLTAIDRAESSRERRVNIYRLGHYLEAGDRVADEVAAGTPLAKAFERAFNPTRGMHVLAQALGLPLTVERGYWVNVK